MKIQKKAVDLTEMAIGILVLAVVVTIGAKILLNYRDTRLTDLDTNTVTNETTFINSTTDTLSATWVKSVDSCLNATSALPINSANYSVSINSVNGVATISNASTVGWNNVYCTYTVYNTTRPDYKLANDSVVGLGEYGSWFKIIVIVGVASLVLALLFSAFGKRDSEVSGSY